jgi:hypothetical protein
MHEQVIAKRKEMQGVSRGTIKNSVDFMMFHVERSIFVPRGTTLHYATHCSTWNNVYDLIILLVESLLGARGDLNLGCE